MTKKIKGHKIYESYKSDFIKEIRKRMIDVDVIQVGLSEKLGITQPHLSNIFKNKRPLSLTKAFALADNLGLKIEISLKNKND